MQSHSPQSIFLTAQQSPHCKASFGCDQKQGSKACLQTPDALPPSLGNTPGVVNLIVVQAASKIHLWVRQQAVYVLSTEEYIVQKHYFVCLEIVVRLWNKLSAAARRDVGITAVVAIMSVAADAAAAAAAAVVAAASAAIAAVAAAAAAAAAAAMCAPALFPGVKSTVMMEAAIAVTWKSAAIVQQPERLQSYVAYLG